MKFANEPCHDRLTYVFDLDGVIYRGEETQPQARETILTLRDQDHNVRFFTNNSGLTRESYSEKLARHGIPTPVEHIMTSAYATALYFTENNAIGKTVYKIGEDGVTRELEAIGMKLISGGDEPDAGIDYVVVGIDRQFSYDKLARAQAAILSGARFIATNEDLTYPAEGGRVVPGNGSLVAAVRAATSVEPLVIGKPETYALEKILQMTSAQRECAYMVGDNLATDVAVGNRAGIHSVLVLGGLTSRQEAESATGVRKPETTIETLGDLLQ